MWYVANRHTQHTVEVSRMPLGPVGFSFSGIFPAHNPWWAEWIRIHSVEFQDWTSRHMTLSTLLPTFVR